MTLDGTFFMEFKLSEIDGAGARDLWLHHAAVDFSDVSNGWICENAVDEIPRR
jgi:hypothetical protein